MSFFKKTTYPLKSSISFIVAGLNYRIENLESIATKNKTYMLDDEKLLKTGKKQVYKYHFKNLIFSMEYEPSNPHDKNAIKIIVNGVHIGYVPAELCLEIKHYISTNRIKTANIFIRGGDYKESKNGNVSYLNEPYRAEIYISLK